MTLYNIPNYTPVTYSIKDIETALLNAGFPASSVITMTAIAGAESSWSNAIQKGQPYSTTGWGAWQITPGDSVPLVGTDLELLDLEVNAKAAFDKWLHQGYEAWTTYNNDVYMKYLHYIPSVPPVADVIDATAFPIKLVKGSDDGDKCD
jgi:hypothetical protein